MAKKSARCRTAFINIVGVLCGLTLAFLANDTWVAHDRAVKAIYKEADSLHAIMTLSKDLGAPVKAELQQAVIAYAQANVAEWPNLASRSINPEPIIQAIQASSPASHQK